MKIALVALGGPASVAGFAATQLAGLSAGLLGLGKGEISAVLNYQSAMPGASLRNQAGERLVQLNLPVASDSAAAAALGGALAAFHLRFVERPALALVLNPWNAWLIGHGAATRGVAVAVDNLVRPQQKTSVLALLLGRTLALRHRAHPSRYRLVAHAEATAAAFAKRFGVTPSVQAVGIDELPARARRPDAVRAEPLLDQKFDLLVGASENPASDAVALRAHSRGAKDRTLIYLPAIDVTKVKSDDLDDAIAKHGKLRIAIATSTNPALGPWLIKSARLVIASDYDLLGAELGGSALLSRGELLAIDSPPNRELLGEAAWVWSGEIGLSNLLTDEPWSRGSRAKLRLQGLKPLTDWQLVAREFLESFEG